LALPALGASEGDRLEIAAWAVDNDPLKAGRWTTGATHRFVVGGEGVALQLLYEQIMRTEAELKALLAAQQKAMDQAARWARSLQEILEHYAQFRQEWELANLVPFTKLLADRQAGLRDESRKNAALPGGKSAAWRQESGGRRQAKVLELTGLAHTGFAGLAT